MAVENSRRGYDVVEHRFVEAALVSVKVTLFERHGGSTLPCMWLCGSGICIAEEPCVCGICNCTMNVVLGGDRDYLNIAAKLNTPAVSSWTPSSHMAEQCRRRKLNTRDGAVVH